MPQKIILNLLLHLLDEDGFVQSVEMASQTQVFLQFEDIGDHTHVLERVHRPVRPLQRAKLEHLTVASCSNVRKLFFRNLILRLVPGTMITTNPCYSQEWFLF